MVLTRAVRAFAKGMKQGLSEEQRRRLQQRDAGRLGVSLESWSLLVATTMDLVGLREAHRIVVGTQSTVRRTARDGAWTFAAAHPGHLRSQPQFFRVGSHVEPAWDLATLKHRMAHVLADVAVRFDEAPIASAAQLVWAIGRAQPFLGNNERLAFLVASRLLNASDLPILPIMEMERDPELEKCIVAATESDRGHLELYLANKVNREVLALAEWLSLDPSSSDARWSLHDEHTALSVLRSSTRQMTDNETFIAEATRTLVAGCELALGSTVTLRSDTSKEELRVARDATYRGCPISPRLPLRELRWSVENDLDFVVVIGAPGRGITGARSLHVSLEVRGFVNPSPAAAFLLVPDEDPVDLHDRFSAWVPSAIGHAVRVSAMRC